MLQTLECCAFSNSAILIVGIYSSVICKHAHYTCAFLDGAQFDNTTCISLLYEIIVVCTNVIHDAKEQCVTHSISTTKKSIIVDRMLCKIILHNSTMANFALLNYFGL